MSGGAIAALRAWADGAGATGVFLLAVLDSVALALPNATDALIMYLTIQHPALWWYYAAVATAGAVLGSLPLYLLAKRGGEAFIDRRMPGPRTSRHHVGPGRASRRGDAAGRALSRSGRGRR